MKVASALVGGRQPRAELAEQAVHAALSKAGLKQAGAVLLFLTRDFVRLPHAAVIAAARAGRCIQVFGSTASGLFTEQDSLIDQAGAAALVIEGRPPGEIPSPGPSISLSGHSTLPFDWQNGAPRAGHLDADAATWTHGRVTADACAATRLPGLSSRFALSTGLRLLSPSLPVEHSRGYDLCRVAGHSAIDNLRRALPADLRAAPPWHQITLLRQPDEPGIAILAANADGSLSLSASLKEGEPIIWALRQPLAAEADMRQSLQKVAEAGGKPDFGLMFSCIGRGPLFYGNEDRDRLAFCQQFPGTPLLGTYGNGQIAPVGGQNRLFHNSVITLLFESPHV